jgi:hypothetical protein
MTNKYADQSKAGEQPRRSLVRGHDAKRKYKSVPEALVVASRMCEQTGEDFEAYFCQVCRRYHVGHALKRS